MSKVKTLIEKFEGLELQYISPLLKTKELCIEKIKEWEGNIQHIPIKYCTEDFFIECIKFNPLVYSFISPSIKKGFSQEFYEKLVNINASFIIDLPDKFKIYKIYLDAMKNNGAFIYLVPNNFITYQLCIEASKTWPYLFEDIPTEYQTADLAAECLLQDKHLYDNLINSKFIKDGLICKLN